MFDFCLFINIVILNLIVEYNMWGMDLFYDFEKNFKKKFICNIKVIYGNKKIFKCLGKFLNVSGWIIVYV